MQLRNGKKTNEVRRPLLKPVLKRNPKIYSVKPTVYKPEKKMICREFIDELKAMLFELGEWNVPIARVGGICEIYEYILTSYVDIKDSEAIAKFLLVVKNKIPFLLGELAMMALKQHDDEAVELIEKTKQVLLDVYKLLA
jgi:hypothetical protein